MSLRNAAVALLPALLAGAGASATEREAFRTSDAPPPGFEDLAGPQTTQVDVYYAGRLLVAALARYDLGTIEFLDPQSVAAKVPQLIDADIVAAALTGPLPHNAARLCSHPAQTDCGELQPAVAAVIFDESRFRADLFLNPLQVEARPVHLSRFLPASSATELSTLHRLSLSVAGGGGDDSANAAMTSMVARGDSRLIARYDAGDQGASIRELSWQRDRGGWEFEAGLFRSFGRSVAFVDEQDIVGTRAGRSLNTRADLDTAQGTPIFLFLNQRSRVDILRDGRLLDSRFYEGGNQQLDTSRLPDGAYRIDVRIAGGDGRERNESYFFVRSGQLPPLDTPLYFAEAGAVADTSSGLIPTIDGDPWVRGGAAWRLRDDFAMELSLLHAGDTTLAEGGAYWFGPGWQMQSSLMSSTAGDVGVALFARMSMGDMAVGIDYRQVAVGDPQSGSYDPLREDFSQGAVTLSAPLYDGRLALRARRDTRQDQATVTGLGLSFARPLWRRGALSVDLEVDAAVQNDDQLVRVSFAGRWRQAQRFTTLRPGMEYRRDATAASGELLLDARSIVQRESPSLGRTTSTLFASREVGRSTVGAQFASDSHLGRGSAEAAYVNDELGGHLAYSANARFGVAGDGDGLAVGGRRGELAAIVIDLHDGPTGVPFEVVVDGQRAGNAVGGRRTIIGLRPYASYRVALRPRGETLVQLDERPREVTLYPGNVQSLTFAPKSITVLVGQALWQDGTPVVNGRFLNVEGYGVTDSDGWFQVEVSGMAPLVVEAPGRQRCVLTPPAIEAEQGLAVLDALTCTPIPAPP